MPKKINIRVLTTAAMLTAMSIIIGIFCKNYMDFGRGLFRITFENLPIILAGIFFGPLVGGIVGAASDVISYLLSTQVYGINLIVTAGAVTVGVVSGIVSHYIVKKNGYVKFVLSCVIAHILGSMIVKSIGLYQFYGVAVMWRIPTYILIIAIESTVLCFLYKNKNFKRLIEDMWSFWR